MNVKRVLVGEPMPDKDDPKYKARYERDYEAGRKFARSMGVGKVAGWLQRVGNAHKKAFLVIVFGFVLTCFGINVYHLICAYQYDQSHAHQTAVERQDSLMQEVIQNRQQLNQ